MSLRIDVWSDVACPWCWVGKRRLEAALASFDDSEGNLDVVLRWRAFELDPSAPRLRDASVDYVERLARKYRTSPAEAQAMIDRMTRTGAEDGLDFRFERVRSGNTFDAHRLLCFAAGHGLQDALKERFFAGYFTEGEPIGEPAALAKMAESVGLDAAEVTRVLETDAFAAEVRDDEEEARAMGVSGVPFFVFGQRLAFSGAQPAEVIRQVLEKAHGESRASPAVEGAACTPDGCA